MSNDFRFPIKQAKLSVVTEPAIDGLEYCNIEGLSEVSDNNFKVLLMPDGLYPCVNVDIVPYAVASFTYDPDEGYGPLAVQFTDASTYAESLLWTFGDGETSNETNPVHTFVDVDVYTVTLYATNIANTDTAVHYVEVLTPGCVYNDDYTLMTPGDGSAIVSQQIGSSLSGAFSVDAYVMWYNYGNDYTLGMMGIYIKDGTSEYRLYFWGERDYAGGYMLRARLRGPDIYTTIATSAYFYPSYPEGNLRMVRNSSGTISFYYNNGSSWNLLSTVNGLSSLTNFGMVGGAYTNDTPDYVTRFDYTIEFTDGCPT